jgi:hypothetical protein
MSLYRLDCRQTTEVGRMLSRLAYASTGAHEMATTMDNEGIQTQTVNRQSTTHLSTLLRRNLLESHYRDNLSPTASDFALFVDSRRSRR